MILLICIFRPFTGMGTLSWVCGMGGGKVGFTGMNSGKEAERGVPVLFGKRQNCCGCYQCLSVCAFKADQSKKGYPVE